MTELPNRANDTKEFIDTQSETSNIVCGMCIRLLTPEILMSLIFWVVLPCGFVGGYQSSDERTSSNFRAILDKLAEDRFFTFLLSL